MGRCAPPPHGSKRRLVSHRLRLEPLESRLPPGDMIGLSGTALWGLSLGLEGRGLRITPIAITELPVSRQDTESTTTRAASLSTGMQISFGPGYRAATHEQASLTSASGAEQDLVDLFNSGLTTPFDLPQPARTTPRGLSQGNPEHGNQGDLMHGPIPGGGGGGSRLPSSAEPIPQQPSSMPAASLPPMSAATAAPNNQSKAAMASRMPTPDEPRRHEPVRRKRNYRFVPTPDDRHYHQPRHAGVGYTASHADLKHVR
jgi:hypothetical protein